MFIKRTLKERALGLRRLLRSSLTPELFNAKVEVFREQILSRDQLAAQARDFAHRYYPSTEVPRDFSLLRDLGIAEDSLDTSYFALARAADEKQVLPPGSEWILDNYHVIEEHLREIKKDLPRGYYKLLPQLRDGPYAARPRVYALAVEYVRNRDSVFDGELLSSFIAAYQELHPLSIGELWAIPIMLRYAILRNLAALATLSLRAYQERKAAEEISEEVLRDAERPGTEMVLNLAKRLEAWPGWVGPGAIHIMRRLRAIGVRTAVALHWIEERFRESGIDPDELIRTEQYARAADQISIGNCVTALRAIALFDWKVWVENNSKIHEILKRDPTAFYEACDFTTRDRYRHEIERIARNARTPEHEVAEKLIKFVEETAGKRAADDGAQSLRDRHVGAYLLGEGTRGFEAFVGAVRPWRERISALLKRHAGFLYFVGIFLFTGFLVSVAVERAFAAGLAHIYLPAIAFLFAILASNLAIQLVQWMVTLSAPTAYVPKLDFDEGLTPEVRSIVTVHCIFSSREAVDRVVEALEVRFLANDDEQLSFALLGDVSDSEKETVTGDQAIIDHAIELIQSLNARYKSEAGDRFYLLFRKRLFNPAEGKFMGWERKRGKIMEFNRLLAGDDSTTFVLHVGEKTALRAHRYVITLDADTQLPRGIARKLIGALHHPLNRPVIDHARKVIVKGYGLLQPRVGVSLRSASASLFSRIFCGHAGIDPYTSLVSEVYQDLFDEASYVGKGAYDPRAFEEVLEGRIPENSLLSHDLFESIFVRTAHVSDIELIDDFPSRYNVFARREHRWIRGDWQLLPWLLPRVPNAAGNAIRNPIGWLGRWKIFDNIRRSLVAPAAFALLLGAFTLFPMWPLFWFSLVLATFLFPIGANLANSVLVAPPRLSLPGYSRNVGQDFLRNCAQAFFHLSVLPHQAFLVLHAAGITLWRLLVTRKHLLEWETAYASEQRSGKSARDFLRSMSGGMLLTAAALALIVVIGPQHLPFAIPLLALWGSAPVIAAWISAPAQGERYVRTQADEDYLVRVARQTWAYFDDHLIEEYNYLIPDNVQMIPTRVVAERTSPTNIGLSLLSLMTANDLGFATLPYVATRINRVFRTLFRLERWNGHFLNWYDIRSLQSLAPRYISAVDSGNLVGHLMALVAGLEEVLHAPIVSAAHFRHIRRAFGVLVERQGKDESDLSKVARKIYQELVSPPRNFRDLHRILETVRLFVRDHRLEYRRLGADAQERDRMINSLCDFAALSDLIAWYGPLEALYEALDAKARSGFSFSRAEKGLRKILLGKNPTMALIVKVHNRIADLLSQRKENFLPQVNDAAVQKAFDQLQNGLQTSMPHAEGIFSEIRSAIDYAEKIVGEMKLSELYDSHRKAFVIGYNLDRGLRDSGHYDLLASEARLTSFVAIARGEVPQQHWFMLGRPITEAFGGRALLSWGGTMFEYFMPILVMKDYPGTLLSDSYRAVIRSQQRYARLRNVPWGMSESGYAGVDFHKTYQYRAFGVPGLGLKRGLSEDLVISPYSTFLALPVAPRESLLNLSALDQEGVHGEYGFYEAIDYTPSRLSKEERGHVVKNFLAHHQGMSLVSINNYLNGGIFQTRFHSNVAVKATELLLHEKFPIAAPALVPHRAEQLALDDTEEGRASRQVVVTTPHTAFPHTRVLSNGYYSVMIDNAGSGFSQIGGHIALTRWREDPVVNSHGSYIFLKDLGNNATWSAAAQPSRAEPEWYEAIFDPAKVEFKRRDLGIVSHTEIVVSPDDHVEIRRVTLTNTSRRPRTIEATSFAEVAMNDSRADLAHPAFSKMFVQSEFLPELETLLFWRRPRSARENTFYLFHMLIMPICWTETTYETSREAFIGRGRSIHNCRALEPNGKLLRNCGAVLDPIFSLRTILELEPGASHTVMFVTGIGKTREDALALATRYRETGSINRAFELALSHSTVELRHQQFTITQAHAFQRLANALIFNIQGARAESAVLSRNQLAQAGLWRFGISGDLPIVLIRVSEPPHLKLLNELLIAHEYLRLRGIVFDLVVLNEYPGGYFQHFQEELEFAVKAGAAGHLLDKRGGIYLRAVGQLSEVEVVLLQTVARVILHGAKGSLSSQLSFSSEAVALSWAGRGRIATAEPGPEADTSQGAVERFAHGAGRHEFSPDGKSFRIQLHPGEATPLPWSNVVSNSRFGFIATERGGGYTWSENSRENRLTPWSNDPVCDPCGEALFIRDLESGSVWSTTPAPAPANQVYAVTHGFGFSTYEVENDSIQSTLTLCGAKEAPVKWWSLTLKNTGSVTRRLELSLYLELVLGVQRETSARYIVTSFDEKSKSLLARNLYNNEFAGRVVAVGASLDLSGYTSRRDEFIGRNGSLSSPLAFQVGRSLAETLSKSVGPGCDALVAAAEVSLAPRERREILFYLCEFPNIEELRTQSRNLSSVAFCAAERRAVDAYWKEIASSIEVKTPSRSLNTLMNGWLLYQALSCRIFGRSAFYQSGGAIGFRDQLQDSLALLPIAPHMVRQQIILHAARQFTEGDVQHWWHPPTGRGVRTRISDDLLWLPYVVHRYIEATGDAGILDVDQSFIEASPLEEGVMESYIQPGESLHRGSIYEHCIIAIDRALTSGPHGLPLIGSGDWNDGMNEVGREGKGESVWLAWFIIDVLKRFAPIARGRRDNYRAQGYEDKIKQLQAAIEGSCWDGEWYLRAFYDDGKPMGSKRNDECRIDSIAQSWSVLSNAGAPERQIKAMESALKHLVKREAGIVELLTPAFDKSQQDPGYIKGYLPGIRENGGQYTHASAWFIMALARMGRGTAAVDLFELINPINLSSTPAGIERYRGEPYVFCGDVYSNPQHAGRAGWSWYTGSAGWMYQAGLHEILGIRFEKDTVLIDPCIPATWKDYEARLRFGNGSVEILVRNPKGVERGIHSFKVNGEESTNRRVARPGSGVVRVEIILG